MSEKRNVIEDDRTPQPDGVKAASDLEDHVTKRAADEVAQRLRENEARPVQH